MTWSRWGRAGVGRCARTVNTGHGLLLPFVACLLGGSITWPRPRDPGETAGSCAVPWEWHRASATLVTSDRGHVEWLGALADPMPAHPAIDRLRSTAAEPIVEVGCQLWRMPGLTDRSTTDWVVRR